MHSPLAPQHRISEVPAFAWRNSDPRLENLRSLSSWKAWLEILHCLSPGTLVSHLKNQNSGMASESPRNSKLQSLILGFSDPTSSDFNSELERLFKDSLWDRTPEELYLAFCDRLLLGMKDWEKSLHHESRKQLLEIAEFEGRMRVYRMIDGSNLRGNCADQGKLLQRLRSDSMMNLPWVDNPILILRNLPNETLFELRIVERFSPGAFWLEVFYALTSGAYSSVFSRVFSNPGDVKIWAIPTLHSSCQRTHWTQRNPEN